MAVSQPPAAPGPRGVLETRCSAGQTHLFLSQYFDLRWLCQEVSTVVPNLSGPSSVQHTPIQSAPAATAPPKPAPPRGAARTPAAEDGEQAPAERSEAAEAAAGQSPSLGRRPRKRGRKRAKNNGATSNVSLSPSIPRATIGRAGAQGRAPSFSMEYLSFSFPLKIEIEV